MNSEKSGITFDVIGDSAPFSMIGKSSGYMITAGGRPYLVDCGAPIFHHFGDEGVRKLKGVFATHSHEDHRRWFTDLARNMLYNPAIKGKVHLITSEVIQEEFEKNSKGALERSLSPDSKRVVEVPYNVFVESTLLGPSSRYQIKYVRKPGEEGVVWRVVDSDGNIVDPQKAKVIIHPKCNRPRMLFKDDEYGEWVEPESFYPFTATCFYHDEYNDYVDKKAGLTARAIKSSAWHGPPSIALKFTTENESLVFSADTVYDRELWEALHKEHRPQNMQMTQREFDEAFVVVADINDFIERTWSKERFERAITAYDGSVVIHDVAKINSVVHTDYPRIAYEKFDNILYTHCPDSLVSERPILKSGKRIRIIGKEVFEEVDGKLFPFDADIYWRNFSQDCVGYKRKSGAYRILKEENGLLSVDAEKKDAPNQLTRVDFYEDIEGQYFPRIHSPFEDYWVRPDRVVEKMTFEEEASKCEIVENIRGKIKKE